PAGPPEQQPAEVGIVEGHHEPAEVVIPPPHRPLLALEAPRGEIARAQGARSADSAARRDLPRAGRRRSPPPPPPRPGARAAPRSRRSDPGTRPRPRPPPTGHPP